MVLNVMVVMADETRTEYIGHQNWLKSEDGGKSFVFSYHIVSEGLQSVAHETPEPTGFSR
jgi:hypothetical protein